MSGMVLSRAQFDRIAKALADPRRFALLEAIASAAEYPCQRLCQDFPVTKATISHHIKELMQAGLVEAERDGQFLHYRARRDVMAAYSQELMTRTDPDFKLPEHLRKKKAV